MGSCRLMCKAMQEKMFLCGKLSFLILVLLSSMFFKAASPETYTVGDNDGWDDDVDFNTWARKYDFKVGDVLLFSYMKTEHDVCQVTEAAYRSCDGREGLVAKYDSGNDLVELKEAKMYWFLCSTPGHCLGGMRFGIDVKQRQASNSTNPPSNNSNCVGSHPFVSLSLSLILGFFPV